MKRSLRPLAVMVVQVAACVGVTAAAPRASAPEVEYDEVVPKDPAVDAAIAESVRAYLHTFKLRESDLATGLSIPFGIYAPGPHLGVRRPGSSSSDDYSGATWHNYHLGAARVTGRTGPQGHVVYEVVEFHAALGSPWEDGSRSAGMVGDLEVAYPGSQRLMEIPPEP